MARGKRNRHGGSKRAAVVPPKPEQKPAEQPDGGLPRGALLGLAALIAVSAVAAFVLLGGDSADDGDMSSAATELAVPWIDPDGQDPIVGAVDVNPADGSIWMSTNTGRPRHVPVV